MEAADLLILCELLIAGRCVSGSGDAGIGGMDELALGGMETERFCESSAEADSGRGPSLQFVARDDEPGRIVALARGAT